MTFIQPNKHGGIMNGILALLSMGFIAVLFGMVGLYNTTVNLDHNITEARTKLDVIGAESTRLNNAIIGALGSDAATAAAAKDGLVSESKPHYFPLGKTDQSWPIASQ
jgi:hypothetical protein